MKLTKKQKTILLLVGTGIFILAVFITTAVVINTKSGGSSVAKPTTPTPIPVPNPNPDDNSGLVTAREEAITLLKQKLTSYSITEGTLLLKLKDKHYLEEDKTDWKEYINLASTPQELETRKANILTIIVELEDVPSPYLSPRDVRPSDTWEGILWDIKKFWETNPKSLQAIKEWVESQNFPDPLEGIDLKGVGMDVLRGQENNGKVAGLDKVSSTNPAYQYKDYVQLSVAGGGNCFLNSFAVFLNGKQGDSSLSNQLRVKFCLELMTGPDRFFEGSEVEKLKIMKEKLVGAHGFALNGRWLDNSDIVYMSFFLKRPVTYVTAIPENVENWGDKFGAHHYPEEGGMPGFVPEYNERWIIYNKRGALSTINRKTRKINIAVEFKVMKENSGYQSFKSGKNYNEKKRIRKFSL